LKKLDDSDMDKIFKKLGVKDSELSAGTVDTHQVAEQAAPPPPPPPPPLPGIPPPPIPQNAAGAAAKPMPMPGFAGQQNAASMQQSQMAGFKPGAPPPGKPGMPPGMPGQGAQMPGAIPPQQKPGMPMTPPQGKGAPPMPGAPAMPGQKPGAPPAPPLPGQAPGQAPGMPGQKPGAPMQGGAMLAKPGMAPPGPPVPKPGMKPGAPPANPAQARGRGASSGLFGEVDDAQVDKLFDKLGLKESNPGAGPVNPGQAPKVNVRDAVNTVRNVAMETGTIAKPPSISGISRLSSNTENEQDKGTGKISSIGKFLLDQQDQQQLGKLTQQDLAESKVRVLTLEAAEEIYKLLNHIATLPGVIGSCIVGHDGIPIANNLPQEYDPETVGALSLGIYVNTTNTIRKMTHTHLHQLVARTSYGFLIIADFGGGILITASNGQHTEELIPLMRSITQLVAP
jgi:predicted regulator of Ras-like GTPase activity (Roadblock/LC7/MglB family)